MEKATYAIGWMCMLMGVPRSTFYAWRSRVETPTMARRRDLVDHVGRVFIHSRKTYGCRRITAALNRDDVEVCVGTVADIMRELGLRAIQPRAYKRTTVAGDGPVVSPDLIERDSPHPNPDSASSATSPTCARDRVGCIWRPCPIWLPGWWSGGRLPAICAPVWSSTP